MRLINRIEQAARSAAWQADRAERARRENSRATLEAVRAEKAREDASWACAVAWRIEGDEDKQPRHKIPVLEGLVIVAEQALALARSHAAKAEIIARPTTMSVAFERSKGKV